MVDPTAVCAPAWVKWFRLAIATVPLEGTTENRPAAAPLPDGTIYHDTDRTSFYFAADGVWYYMCGFMVGTIAPDDERPADFGESDAGFVFWTDDFTRKYVWTGTAWMIERIEPLFGLAADRPLEEGLPNGTVYYATDTTAFSMIVDGTWQAM